jgi:hypothetical protein
MYQQLALGNTTLFLDIYPLHRFYMLRGFDHLKKCLPKRITITDQILWVVNKDKLAFGAAHKEIIEAFDLISHDCIEESVQKLAYHEQINILQATIYDDLTMQAALQANQFSWATGFPSGAAAEIKLTLSAQCGSQSNARNVWFSPNKTAKLYDKNQRLKFVYRAAERFDALLRNDHSAMESSIAAIATNGGT